jgi:tRNA 2-selenouridine synthase
MTDSRLDIADFLGMGVGSAFLDVRSPAEYLRGHIPGALNLPLFTNEERSVIGTLYVQKGSDEAMIKGLELVGPKMKEFVIQAASLTKGRELGIYCWRGGMRSNSMAWLFNTAGIRTYTLEGGYKAWRRYILNYFTRPLNLTVIGGMTGSGKTEILEEIQNKGGRIIHLEQLANHRGSVFGQVGISPQPSTEQFENELYTCISVIPDGEPVYLEDESLAIGQVFIPKALYGQMSAGRFIHLHVPFDLRVNRLVESYAGGDKDLLIGGIRRIEKRLGTENAGRAIHFIQEGNMEKAVEIVLRYYDKLYTRSMGMHHHAEVVDISINKEIPGDIADMILRANLLKQAHVLKSTNHQIIKSSNQ